MKLVSIIILTFYTLTCRAQDDLDKYLKDHHYTFSLESGFDQHTKDLLKQKLNGYRLILLGEGGSHFLQFYEPLGFTWIKFLNEQLGMTHFFMEFGHSSDLLRNQFLQTGDTTYLPKSSIPKSKSFWTSLFEHNKLLPNDKRVSAFGIDFERTHSYSKALKMLLPDLEPTEDIKSSIDLIRTSNDTLKDCDYILSINATLKKALRDNKESFKQYLSTKFDDFEWIVLNNGNCADVLKNRNKHMADNFFKFHKKFKDNIYYGQLGMAHTVLSTKNTASIINSNPEFRNLVCVINTYCYNCTTKEEAVSNWQLHKIEKDILDKLLKYCKSDFTLFDFTDNRAANQKFRNYGQFLIIAKNQR